MMALEILDPDHIVYATGYQFLYPFLRREYGDITENGVIVSNIYQHTFLINEPLITMVGIPIDAISFRYLSIAILVTRYLLLARYFFQQENTKDNG